MTQFTVSEVASRTGFSPSALRYYDKVGLVAPATRSAAGYRLYDERSLERLRFVARAKRLGLHLDDITDLLALWDGEQCGPVQSRLAEMILAKLDETRAEMSELRAFADELTGLRARLAAVPHAGPCEDTCACLAEPAAPEQPHVRLMCDLADATDTLDERVEVYRRLFAAAYVGRDRTVAGIRFRFRADEGVEATVRDLAGREAQCCAFFTSTITTAGGEVLWDAAVPDDDVARAVLDEWFDLPETLPADSSALRERFEARGLRFSSSVGAA